jgi:DNA-binding SARP family transcriptional activator
VRFAILGPVEVGTDEGAVPVKNGRERFVLALLLLGADRLTPTDRIIDALWDEPPPTARTQLHNIIGSLRRRLTGVAGELIVTRPLGYELRLGKHDLDLLDFRRLVARGRQAATEGDVARAADVLQDALALWRGPALADVDDGLADASRRKLHKERVAAAVELLTAQLRLGHHGAMLDQIPALIDQHPHQERLYELQMRALAASGQRSEALATYQQAYRRLVDDLGVEPGPALRDLERQILDGTDLAPSTPTVVTPRQLPAIPATLTGRDQLVAEIGAVLGHADAQGRSKALIVGPGGIGKTTLAIAVAHRLTDHFTDGQLFADLRGSHADAADPHDVLGAFLRALGVPGSGLPDDADERAALYRSMLADKRTLVLLDDAADERQVRPLLPGGADCGVIVTSRQRLSALVDASRWTVPELRPADAVDLAGRIVGPDRVTAEADAAASIVAACGHLPLAVSIAAARLAARTEWSLAEFAERLTDERHRLDELRLGDLDVRTSIALSYAALDAERQRLFRRLGLFSAADWPSWVAHELTDGLTAREVDSSLDDLVDAHLVEPLGRDSIGQTRFRLHDLVAEYAGERALAEESESDRVDAVTRLVSGWLALASEADQHIEHGHTSVTEGLTRPNPPAAASLPDAESAGPWFEVERLNLAKATTDASRVDRADLAAGLAIRLFGFSALHGYRDDQRRTLQAARVCARESGNDDLLSRVLRLLFNCVVETAPPEELEAIATESLAVARRLGDAQSVARACIWAGTAMLRKGRLATADDWLSEGLRTAESCDDPGLRAGLWQATAGAHMQAGRVAEALAPMERALDIQRRRGRSHLVAICLHNYGEVLLADDQFSAAETALTESIELAEELGDHLAVAYSECALAGVDMRRGEWSDAMRRLESAGQVHEAAGDPNGLAAVYCGFGDLALATGRPADATEHYGQACDIWRSMGAPLEIARSLARLELAHHAAGDRRAADACQREWRGILDGLDLNDACLLLPSFLPTPIEAGTPHHDR